MTQTKSKSRFFNAAVVRAVLAFLALSLVALAVWFIGPLLALGELRPLAGLGIRVTTICLMLLFVVLALLGWSVSAVGVACACLLVWHAGPLLMFGSMRPLELQAARVLTIAVIALVYLGWALYRLWVLLRSDHALADLILRRGAHAPKDIARDEVRAVSDVTRKAVAQLRQMHLSMAGSVGSLWSWARCVVEGKRYLYELPWYMVIGTTSAGKTSMLLNSGLRFPVAEQMGTVSAQMALKRDGGTLNCAWWFTNEAVLIDTAGRYTLSERPIPRLSPSASAAPAEAVASSEAPAASMPPAPSPELLDAAEWRGFLGVLRQVRSRAPINGALVVVDMGKLLNDDEGQAMAHAAQLRARLAELRQELGIRFPVYVVVTKTDLLHGFLAYFSSLTTEARAQVWGFTLPWVDGGKTQAQPLVPQLERELQALQRRVADGVAVRLQEEFELKQRQALYVLPHELRAMIPKLMVLLDAVFSESRYDTTQLSHALRGVYFTSAMQGGGPHAVADRRALIPRLGQAVSALFARQPRTGDVLSKAQGSRGAPGDAGNLHGTRSFFLADALSRVVFPEAHLVKPNLRWEARFRLMRLSGHALMFVLFGWLASALMLSHANNRAYLADVAAKTEALTSGMAVLAGRRSTEKMIEVLDMAQALPTHSGLNLADPALSYQYGLYTAESVAEAARMAYGSLQDRLILPVLTRRMESVMREALQAEAAELAHDTLYVYLLLHDKSRYATSPQAAQAVRGWVNDDWREGDESTGGTQATEDSASPGEGNVTRTKASRDKAAPPPALGLAAAFGHSSAMISHLEDMFSSQRLVQSSTVQDEALVRRVRAFLDATPTGERLYQRTKAALMPDAPQDFTLVRALGPQAAMLFSRASGDTLENGVPGFFTYDGYHALFAKRLSEMVAVVLADDAWVMGRDGAPGAPRKAEAAGQPDETRMQMEEIRRQYLTEYADTWTDFLADIRVISAESGGSLAFELNVLRQLAAPDSPLTRLGRMAARETTLSRSLKTADAEEKSLFDKAAEQVGKKAAQVSQDLGLSAEQRAQRQLVDERFAALREVVTGQREGTTMPGAGGKPALDGIANLLNEYYTALVVADAAISAGALPPTGVEVATKIRIEAGKLPAPFREVLLGIGSGGTDKVAQGAASILRVQAQAQMDRLMGILALTVGEPCMRTIVGRYPFAASSQEVAVDDFNALFAAGGAADAYFNKYLAPLVDTSSRPWKYRNPEFASALVDADAMTGGQTQGVAATRGPTLSGELLKLLAAHGPDPDFFARVGQIREAYFKEPGARRMAWKLDVSVQTLEANVMELLIDLDGQVQRYSHGPVQTLQVQWPGPRGGTMADIGVQPRIKADTSTISMRGPWALLRLMERGRIIAGADTGQVAVEFLFDGRRAVLEVGSSGVNPLSSTLLKSFSCPQRSA